MENKNIKVGSKLYFTDTGDFFGTVVKILKTTCWVKQKNGSIKKRWPLDFAEDMAK